jgi:hypothetical protein
MELDRVESSTTVAEPCLIVAGEDLPEPARATLVEAGRREGLRVVTWSGSRDVPAARAPAVFVAGLPPGSRVVPEPVVRAMALMPPRVPLLLLCGERLVRPTVTTQGGRVTLLGPPLSGARVASRIRMLLAKTEEAPEDLFSVARDCVGDPAAAATSEHRRPHYWVGTFGPRDHEGPRLPSLTQRASSGVVVVLAPTGAREDEVDQVTRVLRRKERDDQKAVALANVLGEERALLHLGPGGEEWIVYLPRPDWSLAIFSPRRVPHLWDLSASLRRSGRRVARLEAAGGDVVVAMTGRPDDSTIAERQTAMADGGPALLRLLCAGRFQTQSPSGVIAERL